MKLVHAERLGEAFDSQLVIGVRESYGEKHRNTGHLIVPISARCEAYRTMSVFCDHIQYRLFLSEPKYLCDGAVFSFPFFFSEQ